MKRDILDRLLGAREARRPAVLLTDLAGGAQCLVLPEGEAESGGETAGDLMPGPALLAAAAEALRTDRAATVAAEGAVGERDAVERAPDGAAAGIFVQPFNPPLRLIVVGAVHIAQALAPMAALAGYDVTVIDPRRAFASDERFPGVAVRCDWPDDGLAALAPDRRSAVVTLTHDPKLDDPALDAALRAPCFYIAALGSRRTHAQRLKRLAALGHGPAALARIHGPAGLALGAVSPAEIAVSILAQMTQVLRQDQVTDVPREPAP